ncbi:hypothetical protein [Adhaeribacter aquaticus]|uniref:hypothetical protein n=1 Tax=Adhaeribacter aquaticus TaxID=299567 RepID=UPI0004056E96|nr:hypothetical protein [Adhaeribacter aquaticus]
MKTTFTFLGVFWLHFFVVIAPVKAQYTPKLSLKNSLLRNAIFDNEKLALTGALGMSVMNSDNRARGYQSKGIGLIKGNGYGVNASVGALYQVVPNIGVSGSLEYNQFKGLQDQEAPVEKRTGSFTFQSNVIAASSSVVINLAPKNTIAKFNKPTGHVRFSDSPFENFIHIIQKHCVALPYVKAGVSIIQVKAATLTGNDLEVANGKTPLFSASLPVGGGIRLRYSDNISIAPEFTYNLTFSDYLDNTKMKGGYLGPNDNFVSGAIKIFYTPAGPKKKIRQL